MKKVRWMFKCVVIGSWEFSLLMCLFWLLIMMIGCRSNKIEIRAPGRVITVQGNNLLANNLAISQLMGLEQIKKCRTIHVTRGEVDDRVDVTETSESDAEGKVECEVVVGPNLFNEDYITMVLGKDTPLGQALAQNPDARLLINGDVIEYDPNAGTKAKVKRGIFFNDNNIEVTFQIYDQQDRPMGTYIVPKKGYKENIFLPVGNYKVMIYWKDGTKDRSRMIKLYVNEQSDDFQYGASKYDFSYNCDNKRAGY